MRAVNVRFLNNLRTLCTKQHHSTETNSLKCKEEFLLQHTWDWKLVIDILIVRKQFAVPKEALWCCALKWSAHTRELEVCFGSAQHHKRQQGTEAPEKGNRGIGGLLFVVLNPSYTLPNLDLKFTWEYPWCCITDHWMPQIPWQLAGSAGIAAEWCDFSTSWRTSCLTHTELLELSIAASAGRTLAAHLCWGSVVASATRTLWTGFCQLQLWQENLSSRNIRRKALKTSAFG